MSCLRTILRGDSQTIGNSPLCSSSPALTQSNPTLSKQINSSAKSKTFVKNYTIFSFSSQNLHRAFLSQCFHDVNLSLFIYRPELFFKIPFCPDFMCYCHQYIEQAPSHGRKSIAFEFLPEKKLRYFDTFSALLSEAVLPNFKV